MIKRREQIRWLNSQLLGEMPEYRPQAESFPNEHTAQRCLLRSLMNVRAPLPLRQGFLKAQDALPSAEREEKGVVDAAQLPAAPSDPCLALAAENDLKSIAFRCISTGEFSFSESGGGKNRGADRPGVFTAGNLCKTGNLECFQRRRSGNLP